MEEVIKRFLFTDSSYNDGFGYEDGYGHDDDSSYNDGIGVGSGLGSGFGYEDGFGVGSDFDSGLGYDHDSGIKSYDGHEVHRIDNLQTIIYSIHGNIARGAIINEDLTLKDCYIAKYEGHFAHGETVAQAMADARSKVYQDKPIEERIDYVIESYPDVDRPIEHSVLFSLHNFLTGSCLFGRQEFAESHALDPKHGSMTMREFIHLTKDAYGGVNIRQLADAYKIKL